MTKSQLVAAIAQRASIDARKADQYLEATLQVLADALARGESVPLVGFGTFSVSERPARYGPDPRTGTSRRIESHRAVSFRAGTQLRAALRGGRPAPKSAPKPSPEES